jgi:hypothetical protein
VTVVMLQPHAPRALLPIVLCWIGVASAGVQGPPEVSPGSAGAIGVRNAHAMAFDPRGARVVLFGGADASSVRNETWTWEPRARRWARLDAGSPPARTFPALAADEARGELVLFGGNRVLFGRDGEQNTLLDDTWVLRGGRWVRLEVRGPGARAEAAMARDPRRQRVVLFGGYGRTSEGRVRYGDTWEWNGERWDLAATGGPAPRNGGALAYDDRRGRVVLSGGPPAVAGPETWEWDGRVWQRGPDRPPPARFNPAMAYHAAIAALVRFGGWTGRDRVSETWIRGDAGWSEIGGERPAPRNHSAVAYDPVRQRVVLFGGHDGDQVFGDTWEFDGRAWTLEASVPPQKRADNQH